MNWIRIMFARQRPVRTGAVLLVLLVSGASVRADDFDFLKGGPIDAATAAAMREIARQADRVTGEGGPAADPAADPAGVLAGAQAIGGAIGRAAPPMAMPEALQAATTAAAAVRGAGAERGVAAGASHDAIASPNDRDLVLFVSSAMGQPALRQTLREALADGHTRVVLRGVLPGERIGDAVRRVAPLLSGMNPPPSIDFDPPSFRKAGIEDVPTIWDPATGSQWRGSVALTAFRRRLGETVATFSESVGPATPVAELDLEEVLKAQVAKLDFDTMRQQAYQRYWRRVELVALPAAENSRVRTVDPTVWLSEPLRDAAGRVAVDAGTRINTLEMHPWARQLVVFDATNARQMAWAVLQAKHARASIFLTSAVDRDAGWDGWQHLVTALGKPLFLLDATLAQRTDVHVVPSVVEQVGSVLHVREIGHADLEAELQAAR
jgi:conjugal transfer pilus assembly protein TraW